MEKIDFQNFLVSRDDGISFQHVLEVNAFPEMFVVSPLVFIRLKEGLLIDLFGDDPELKIELRHQEGRPQLIISTTYGEWAFYWDGSNSGSAEQQLKKFQTFLNEQLGKE